ncbi:LOW QUALITY PROTEIN: uncharacterized protein LOC121676802 [Corvus kubaryi]|uniref:LOW QUALITY PROTEIN: uncharacterized protein LOC121676802 n=1 Tax=Corvus kubaryi TaxID=68294 RepID=UPI001C0469AA|nr:LOW QUALITY PROTEIN: uncharacterized protein LOC121676802 [Corvus kubaryi]
MPAGEGWGCRAARWDLRWCWDAFSHHPTQDTVQHPEQSNTLPRNSTQCNPKENSCGRELTVTEDDSPYSLIRLLKKKEAQEMEKALAEKYKVGKMCGCWGIVGRARGFLEGFWEAGDKFWVQAARSPSLWCCQASRERMKVIADQWRDLHAKRAQLKAHVERCGRTIQEREELRIQALEINSKQREEKMKKDGKLLRAKMELEALRKKHWKLCKRVQKCSIFKEYLENVVKFSQFEDISEVTSWYKLLVRTQKDLMQSQQGHKQLTEQDKVLLEQYRAEKEAEMLQYKNELVQFKLHFDQAQSDIPLWVRNCGVGRGRSPSLALSRLADVSSFSHGVMAESSNSAWDWRRFLIFPPPRGCRRKNGRPVWSMDVWVSQPGALVLKHHLCWGMSPCCLCPPFQEAHWADIQSKTSEKTRKLWTIKLAIHNLFQSTNMWLQAEWNVLKYDSCRQLKMVKPRQKEEQ